MRCTGVALALVMGLAVRATGQTGPLTRYAGGGPAATDCMLVMDVAGATGRRAAACTDGDPTCDADGAANGTCTFGVRVCLDAVTGGSPRCHADVVTAAEVVSPTPPLAAALGTLVMPVATPDTCTALATVTVATGGRRSAKTVVRTRATMASGHADRDRLILVCRRAATAGATFATVQRKVLAGCTAPSCHGAGGAGGLVLSPGEAYANLVGVPASNPAAQAAGLLRVAPGDATNSFLLRKLTGALGGAEGAPMPFGGAPLSASSIDLVRRWISAGATADAPF